ncbi:GNAT family N-acetyltransferase [Sphingomonas sp. AR_OL41]|uniref:GNAT family N-acetyltransferase n=1 Tax=Sphingomonas sp. AR_OL41 TaxID=3042729 RepID=UPI0024805A94|nr:GNAT family N-acetyltransferase [Sphingomonas sp. AR_OL41]MDH7971193.1 GNAT family N-acetyltransferase [Sphingomonas sp. AR_OL41]
MIDTERLILRGWRATDVDPFNAMCRDPEVMRYLGPPESREQTAAALDRQNGFLASLGHCFWAVERRADGVLLGFCGIKPGAAGTPIEQDIEIGWRLGRAHWGQGYAREAAEASLAWGWANTTAPLISAITVQANTASWGLMERIGLTRIVGGDFHHPLAAPPLNPHILYRIDRPA